MVLDITYLNAPPEQIQGVRLATVYPQPDYLAKSEIVIHFAGKQRNINLQNVKTIQITND